MNELHIPKAHVQKLLWAKNPDVAVLYLYVTDGGDPKQEDEAVARAKQIAQQRAAADKQSADILGQYLR